MDRRKQRNGNAGSSPLSRGIRHCPPGRMGRRRIIPALAGNTLDPVDHTKIDRDHPRSRGEYSLQRQSGQSPWGSSPLSRGILTVTLLPYGEPRIIPALAGNTSVPVSRGWSYADHPRSRGEYVTAASHRPAGRGSSPLSRGIPSHLVPQSSPGRIIPALAGNTGSMVTLRFGTSDHPRSRGEYWRLGTVRR